MLRWCSFSGCGRKHVAVVFGSAGSKYLINGCLQPIGTEITQHAKLRLVEAPLRLLLSIARWPRYCVFCQYELPIRQLCIPETKPLLNYSTYKTRNRWHSVDAHFNLLFIQHLLPSIIVFIMGWNYWLSFWKIKTRPCAKAEHSNILALFALTRLTVIYLAKRFIAPGIHLFINW